MTYAPRPVAGTSSGYDKVAARTPFFRFALVAGTVRYATESFDHAPAVPVAFHGVTGPRAANTCGWTWRWTPGLDASASMNQVSRNRQWSWRAEQSYGVSRTARWLPASSEIVRGRSPS